VLHGAGARAALTLSSNEVRKDFLLEKRSKNFCSFRARVAATRAHGGKSFLVLFFKKELLPF
jgi:hypothetical protein